MYSLKFINNNNGQKTIIPNIPCANSFSKKLVGLMGKNKFNGLIFKQNTNGRLKNSIHTSFMRKNIDVLYINHEMNIQEYSTLKKWKLYIPKNGKIKYIIELPENTINKFKLDTNTHLVIENEEKTG